MTTSYGIVVEGASSAPRAPGSSPVRSRCSPELRVGACVVRIERQRLARQRDGLVEAVVARRVRAGDAVDLAVPRVDRQRRRDVRLEVGRAVLDERDRRLRARAPRGSTG